MVALSVTKTVSTLLDRAIARRATPCSRQQSAAGYWLFELEADCTIPAEYIMMMHFLDEIDAELEAKIAAYLRSHQQPDGGWPLYHGGEFNMSCTVKAYYALKLAGDDVRAPHMVRARARDPRARRRRPVERLHADRAGAVRADSLARSALHPGRDHAAAEVVLLPPRQGVVLVAHGDGAAVHALHAQAAARRIRDRCDIRELFTTPPEVERDYFRDARKGGWLGRVLLVVDRLSRRIDPLIPKAMRARATRARRTVDARAA